jgi:hypothetical protein
MGYCWSVQRTLTTMDAFDDDDDFADPKWKRTKLPNNYSNKTIQNYYQHIKVLNMEGFWEVERQGMKYAI